MNMLFSLLRSESCSFGCSFPCCREPCQTFETAQPELDVYDLFCINLVKTFTDVLKLRRYLNLCLLVRAPVSLQTPPGASFSLVVTSTNGTAALSRVTTVASVSVTSGLLVPSIFSDLYISWLGIRHPC